MLYKTPLTVLEFNGTTVRISRSIREKAKRIVTHCFSFEASDFEKEAPGLIERTMRSHRLKPEDVILALPRYAVLSRFLRLPSQNEEEIKEMVSLMVFREGGNTKENQMIYDFKRVGFDRKGYALVTVFLISRERLKKYLDILKNARIFPARVTLNTQGLLNWSKLQSLETEDQAKQCIFLLNIDHGIGDFNVFAGGYPIFSRSFILSQDPDSGIHLSKEIKISLELFRRMGNGVLEWDERLYLTGAWKSQDAAILKNLNFKEVVPIDPVANLGDRISLANDMAGDSISYASVLGLALSPGTEAIDIAPKELTVQVRKKKEQRLLRRLMIVMVAVIFGASFLFFMMIEAKIDRLLDSKKKLRRLSSYEKAMEEDQKRFYLEEKVLKTGSLLNILDRLYDLRPTAVFITDLDIEEGVSLSIAGFSTDLISVFDFMQRLKKSPLMESVRLDYVDAKQKGSEKFRITCSISRHDQNIK
jgi:Tfp pilus assembly protein PilN